MLRMVKVERFEDLNVWQEARMLANDVYKSILSNDTIRDYPLKDQLNRSSGSVMDNIAEGFDRKGNKEFRQFLTVAHGSNGETKSQLYRSFDRNYITKNQLDQFLKRVENISKMINGLIKYLNKTELTGAKYKVEEEAEFYGLENFEL